MTATPGPNQPARPPGLVGRCRAIIGMCVVAVGAGIGGFYAGALHDGSAVHASTGQVPGLEYFLRESSFSEVANARDTLQASASQWVAALQVDGAIVGARSHGSGPVGTRTAGGEDLARAIEGLREGIEEFRGTEQELFLVQHLLWTLRAGGEWEQWLEVYLDTLYRHPASPVVSRGSVEAWRIARTAGCEEAVLRAFAHLSAIPFDFQAKHDVRQMLPSASIAGTRKGQGPIPGGTAW